MDTRPRLEIAAWQAKKPNNRKVRLNCDCGGTYIPDAKLYWLGLSPCRCPACGTLQVTEDWLDSYEGV